jgi:hypothetical protein
LLVPLFFLVSFNFSFLSRPPLPGVMSRFTASPFRKPSPFEFPRTPLSPPETMSDQMGSAHPSVLGAMAPDPYHVEPETVQHVHNLQTSETPGARFRRVSSLAYHSSGLRESRERAVQRSSKFFVVIVPPPVILQEHGLLGHTLSLGPQHRLSDGLLMPLYPTMYGQLSAIAKEFNFPSVSGICLYFHFSENGITATPRISDDSWQMIWSNVLDPSIAPPRVPIVGKLEFDIDVRHARWYPAWITSAHRDLDVPASVGSTAHSVAHFRGDSRHSAAHFRGDSRTTELEINLHDDQLDSESVSPPSGRLPRKLSLVDRLDSSLRAVAATRTVATSPENVLSPIFQEDEPKTAKLSDSLEKRVNSWRASASLTPSVLAAKGQTSLEPANLPNTMFLDDVANEEVEEELNLEDFTWSISSLGPNDWEDGSVSSLRERITTPDIARRMYEDCPPTPSDHTSWGPPSWPPSPMSFSRTSSVHLADRAVFSPPLTPSTATSWGPASWPPSPMSLNRPPSVHLADRAVFSPPPTPSTATSWGPASWPPSPATPFYIRTPDAGERTFDPDDFVFSSAPLMNDWPYQQQQQYDESTVSVQLPYPFLYIYPSVYPYSLEVYPAIPIRSRRLSQSVVVKIASGYPDFEIYEQQRAFDSGDPVAVSAPWMYVWPYQQKQQYDELSVSSRNRQSSKAPVSVHLPYPSLRIYPSVYPYSLEVYPEISSSTQQSNETVVVKVASEYPVFEIYPQQRAFDFDDVVNVSVPWTCVWPYQRHSLSESPVSVRLPYPSLCIYPPVYPYSLDIYPALSGSNQQLNKTVVVKVVSEYPDFEIYEQQLAFGYDDVLSASVPWACVWPYQQHRYAAASSRTHPLRESPVSVRLPYPSLCIYPPVYPYSLDIYPVLSGSSQQLNKTVVVKVASGYPDFEIYEQQLVFGPDGVLSASAPWACVWPYQQQHRYTTASSRSHPLRESPVSVRLPYPSLCIYPPVYPHSLVVYPPLSGSSQQSDKTVVVKVVSEYPDFELYEQQHAFGSDGVVSALTPWACVWPYQQQHWNAAVSSRSHSLIELTSVVVKVASSYPDFEIYEQLAFGSDNLASASTPWMHVWPYQQQRQSEKHGYTSRSHRLSESSLLVHLPYPSLCIYPSVYPHSLDVYPAVPGRSQQSSKTVLVKIASGYPRFEIYPFEVTNDIKISLGSGDCPDFVIYPLRQKQQFSEVQVVNRTWCYPIFDLYPGVYPHLTPYPSIHSPFVGPPVSETDGSRQARQYPVIYPHPQYPDFDLYYYSVNSQRGNAHDTTSSKPKYPVFDLYPAVYPHIVPYASVVATILMPPSAFPTKVVKLINVHSSRKSHRLLHSEVFLDGLVSTPSGALQGIAHQPFMVKQRKSHCTLHDELFPDGVVSTPSGTVAIRELRTSFRPETPSRPVGGRVRSGSVSQRPLSSVGPPPVHGLPPRPNFRLPAYNEPESSPSNPSVGSAHQASLSFPSGSPLPARSTSLRMGVPARTSLNTDPSNPAPLKRSASSVNSYTRMSSLRAMNNGLEPVVEGTPSSLERSASVGVQRLPQRPENDGRTLPGKRDSVVLQRVRAFEGTESDSSRFSKTLREFPLPPPPPPPSGGLPPIPTRHTSLLNPRPQ